MVTGKSLEDKALPMDLSYCTNSTKGTFVLDGCGYGGFTWTLDSPYEDLMDRV